MEPDAGECRFDGEEAENEEGETNDLEDKCGNRENCKFWTSRGGHLVPGG